MTPGCSGMDAFHLLTLEVKRKMKAKCIGCGRWIDIRVLTFVNVRGIDGCGTLQWSCYGCVDEILVLEHEREMKMVA